MKQQWKFGQFKQCSTEKCIYGDLQQIINSRWLADGLGHNSNKKISMRLDDIFFSVLFNFLAVSTVIMLVGKKIRVCFCWKIGDLNV